MGPDNSKDRAAINKREKMAAGIGFGKGDNRHWGTLSLTCPTHIFGQMLSQQGLTGAVWVGARSFGVAGV